MSRAEPRRTTTSRAMSDAADALLPLLAQQVEAYQAMLTLIQRKQEAIRRARVQDVPPIVEKQQQLLQIVHEINSQCSRVMRDLTSQLPKTAPSTDLTISAIAAQVDQTRGEQLRSVLSELQNAQQEVKQQSSVVQQAAEALANHMNGIMKTVRAVLAGPTVYSRSGELAGQANAAMANIDVRT